MIEHPQITATPNLFTPPKLRAFSKLQRIFKPLRVKLVSVLVFILFVLIIVTGVTNTKQESDSAKYSSKGDQQYDSRIEKTFLPKSGTAFKYNSPTLIDKYLYLGTSTKVSFEGDHEAVLSAIPDNYFYKMDLDLNVVWEYSLGEPMVVGGAVLDSDDNIYFVTEALRADNNAQNKYRFFMVTLYLTSLTNDGKFRWQQQISVTDDAWDHSMITPAISLDDVIYVGHDRFYAFDTEGDLIKQYPDNLQTIRWYSGSPIIDRQGNVYFTSPQPIDDNQKSEADVIKAYKFSPRLSELIWSTQMGNEIMDPEGPTGNGSGGGGNQKSFGIDSTPAFGVDEKIMYGITGCTVSKIDTQTGRLLWAIKPEGATGHFNASPAVDGNDNLYVGTKSNLESKFYAIKFDGTLLWKRDIGADMYTSPIIGDDNTVYAGSESRPEGKFMAFDMPTGGTKWAIGKDKELKMSDFSMGSMLLKDGFVYTGVHEAPQGKENYNDIDFTLFKIKVDAKNYLPSSPWPRFHGSNENTGQSIIKSGLRIEDLEPTAKQPEISKTPTLIPTKIINNPTITSFPTPTSITQSTSTPTPLLSATSIPTNTPKPTNTSVPMPTTYQLELNSVSTPYVNESDVSSVNEAYSMDPNNPYWGFTHPGVDFMIEKSSIPVQAATSGIVENLLIEKSEGIMGWHAGFCINHGVNAVCYNLESFGSTDEIGNLVRANVFVQNGSVVNQGDIIGNLIYGGSGSHIDFGITYPGTRICPEPYFTQAARESVMRLIHKTQPTWPMCY